MLFSGSPRDTLRWTCKGLQLITRGAGQGLIRLCPVFFSVAAVWVKNVRIKSPISLYNITNTGG